MVRNLAAELLLMDDRPDRDVVFSAARCHLFVDFHRRCFGEARSVGDDGNVVDIESGHTSRDEASDFIFEVRVWIVDDALVFDVNGCCDFLFFFAGCDFFRWEGDLDARVEDAVHEHDCVGDLLGETGLVPDGFLLFARW